MQVFYKKFGVFKAYLFARASPGPDAVEDIVVGGGDNKTDGVRDEFRNMEFLFAKPCEAEVDNCTGNAYDTETQEF